MQSKISFLYIFFIIISSCTLEKDNNLIKKIIDKKNISQPESKPDRAPGLHGHKEAPTTEKGLDGCHRSGKVRTVFRDRESSSAGNHPGASDVGLVPHTI